MATLPMLRGFSENRCFFPRLSDFLFGHTVIQLMFFFSEASLDLLNSVWNFGGKIYVEI